MKKIAAALIAFIAVFLTMVFPSWIELITGSDPDGRDGSVERLIAGGLLTLAGLTLAAAAMNSRRGAKRRAADTGTAADVTN